MGIRLSFDLDGVLANWGSSVIEIANSLWPGKIPIDYAPTHWDWPDVLKKDEWDTIWSIIKTQPDFWLQITPYEKNISELQEFLKEFPETRLFFITARISTGGVKARSQTEQWLEKFGLWPRNGLSTVLVSRPENKVNLMREANIAFSLDDKKETVAACQMLLNHEAYLFDQPWNQDSSLPRVFSIKEYLEKTTALQPLR